MVASDCALALSIGDELRDDVVFIRKHCAHFVTRDELESEQMETVRDTARRLFSRFRIVERLIDAMVDAISATMPPQSTSPSIMLPLASHFLCEPISDELFVETKGARLDDIHRLFDTCHVLCIC